MKFSEAWLREWVNPPIEREALFEQLTMAGLEIEGFAPVADAFTGVVVGEVVSVGAHPDADKLSVCEVNDGANRLQVVCGAPNVRAGMKSAFARVGAVLPGNFKIKQAKLRGVESQGMLCSAAELGVGDDHDGIVELDAGLAPGREVREVLGLDDVTAELNLTPNRGDCLSIRGLAREVAVLNDMPVEVPAVAAAPVAIDETLPVALEAPAGCPRFLGRVIRGVNIAAATPLWMREKLRRSGLRSVDAVVDVTNYVMLELGQPMHAYDRNRLRDGIVVRLARSGEALELLDGQTVKLDTDTLLISDAEGPVGMAGVMGGERSGTQPDTRDVFLECAFFAPLAVAGTARRYGLHTDASHRYERGVDFELQHRAVERATGLLLEIVGGDAGPVTEAVAPEHLPVRRQVRLRERRLQQLMGVAIDTAEVDSALTRLDFELAERSICTEEGVCWTIEAPTHRFDIEREADLVEEVCRIYGYNRVPSRRPKTELELRQVPRGISSELELKKLLADLGFQEAVTYSFVDPKLQDLLEPGTAPLALANPMSSEQSVMRTNLLPGLVETLRVNLARQQERVRLFESGLCFLPGEPVRQVFRLGGVCCGPRVPANWAQPAQAVDFFDMKGLVERLFEWAGLGDRVSYRAAVDPVLHPGQGAEIRLDDAAVGRLGRLHPQLEAALGLTKAVYLFEIEGETILKKALRRHRGISRFPSVRRDLAIVVGLEVPAAQVETTVRETLGEILVDFTLFDLYQGKGVDSNEKSLAVGLTLQDASATLTEDRISRYTQDVLAALERAVGARLRSGGSGS